MMNEVVRKNDFAVIGAEFRAGAQRSGAGLRDHGTDTVTLSMTPDCRNVRWRLPRYKSVALLASPRESEGGAKYSRHRQTQRERGNIDGPIDTMTIRLWTRIRVIN
ncbi:hypothetical protein ALC56_09275 [Trachymyrmex septentrionalis]|uniref:Uncharacterized protein n=1 Tax=Trachymyrmex septentrionalis TaxID=34720 RepID=A0A195F6U0_9HYME|nr:hypothetical protein ALC56_09275 [Trachymyrmex septentrionalis]